MNQNVNKQADFIIHQSNCCLGTLNTNSIKISQNNLFSITTSNGVCFIKSDDDWDEINKNKQFIKYFLPNPTETYTQNIHLFIKEILPKLNLDEKHKINLDHTICPYNNSGLYKRYRNFEWSFGDILTDEPLFALLSIEHELWIYEFTENEFKKLININEILLNNFYKIYTSSFDINYECLRDIVYSNSIIHMAWTEFKKSKKNLNLRVCLLICLTKNGIFCFFEIIQSSIETTCKFLCYWRLESKKSPIKTFYYFNDYLVLIYTNGVVEIFLMILEYEKRPFDFAGMLKTNLIIWEEEDDLGVDQLLIYEKKNLIYVVFTKSNYIIVKILSKLKSSAKEINFDELVLSRSIIEEGLFTMPCNGICKLFDDFILLTSIDGNYILIQINKSPKLAQTILNIPKLTLPNYCPKSLASTKDGFICCSISNICIYHDHLEIRDSTQINIFTLISKKDILSKILKLINLNQDVNFKDFHNLLECFKFYMVNEKFDYKVKDFLLINLNDYTDSSLKLIHFLLICKNCIILSSNDLCTNYSENSFESINIENDNDKKLVSKNLDLIKKIEIILIKRHINKLLKNFNFSKMTKEQKISKENMLNFINNKSKTTEVCPICNQSIEFTNYYSGICSNKHKFSRCNYSLLVCDLSKYDYKVCKFCKKSFYIYPFIWINENPNFCLFCT